MLDTFLQIGPDFWNSLVGIGTIIAAFGSMGFLIVTIKQASNARFLEFIKDVDLELAGQLEKESKLGGHDDCIVHAYNYIDTCDRVMFLIKKKRVQKDFFEYYLDFFNYAVTMMWGYATLEKNDKYSLNSSWPTLTAWILEAKRTPYPFAHLPIVMKKELDEKKNIDKDSLYIELVGLIKQARQSTD